MVETPTQNQPRDNDGDGREARPAPPATPETQPSASAEMVQLPKAEYDALLRKAQEQALYLDELRRLKAEFENFQKRIRRERPAWEAQSLRRLAQDVLPVLDNFERALGAPESAAPESLVAGVRLVYQLLRSALENHGIEPLEQGLGAVFDPQFHEAVAQVDCADPAQIGRVVGVMQKGYRHGEVVIRPARVAVGRAARGAGEAGDGSHGASPPAPGQESPA